MGLIVASRDPFLGQQVLCEPYYGWGWRRLDDRNVNAYEVAMAGGIFRARISQFFDLQGERRGFTGVVEQPGHPFDSLLIVTTSMHVGDYDFADYLCARYDVELGPVLPDLLGNEMSVGTPRYSGNMCVACTREAPQQPKRPK